MFSFVQNIVSVFEPLKTESVDTHLDKNHNKKKKFINKNKKQQNNKTVHEDYHNKQVNNFSIESLIYFLEEFLETRLIGKFEPQTDISTNEPWKNEANNNNLNKHNMIEIPQKSQANYAANAYAHCAEHVQEDTPKTPPSSLENESKLLNNTNKIYSLIKDLRALKKANITHLHIIDDVSFLTGIKQAIDAYKKEKIYTPEHANNA